MKTYTAPLLVEYGDVAEITATLGSPFTGDTSWDIDGTILDEGPNSVNQCPTTDNNICV